MRKTKYFINKLDFLDETITNYNIKSNSLTIKKHKQFIHIFSNMKDFRIEGKCVYPIETLLLIIFLAKSEGEGDNCLAIARYAKYSADMLYELNLINKDDNGELKKLLKIDGI